VAQADKKLADAQRSELMVRLDHTQIRAPASGIVSRRTARIGAVASAAGDPLFRIIRDGDVELEADVPETTLARMLPDMKAQVFTASRKEPFSAHVRLVSPEVSPTTRLGRVRIAIDQAPGLTIGAFGRASVEIASHDGVLVPQSAVLYSEEGATVQVVKDDTVSTKAVTLGLRTESHAEIVKGVGAGDAIVATAGTFVRDGDKVSPVDVATATPQAK
jgi:RND family efflux transporter MFP subunit